MKPAPQMQQIITQIAAKHDFDLATVSVGSALRLDMPNFDRLCIEKIGAHTISVAHYFGQHGDLVADPEIVFWIGPDGGWYPSYIQQTIFPPREVLVFGEDGTPSGIRRSAQREVASFANMWGKNIKAHGYLDHATLTRRHIDPIEDAA